MSIIAAGTTTTTALSSTGNTDGTLQFQVNGTTPSVTLNTLGAVGVGAVPNFGTSGQALVSGGATAAPTWANVTTSPAGTTGQVQINNTGSFGAVGSGTAGQVLTSQGAGAAPVFATFGLTSVTQSVINTNTNAVAGTYYTITASLTLTLPASPTAGQFVAFSNRSGTTTAVIARNGLNIMTLAEDMVLDSAQARGTLVYTNPTNGWVLFSD